MGWKRPGKDHRHSLPSFPTNSLCISLVSVCLSVWVFVLPNISAPCFRCPPSTGPFHSSCSNYQWELKKWLVFGAVVPLGTLQLKNMMRHGRDFQEDFGSWVQLELEPTVLASWPYGRSSLLGLLLYPEWHILLIPGCLFWRWASSIVVIALLDGALCSKKHFHTRTTSCFSPNVPKASKLHPGTTPPFFF